MLQGAAGATPGRPSNSVRMLAAYFDASAGYRTDGDGGASASAALQGLRLESHIVLNSDEVEQKLASISQARIALSRAAFSLPGLEPADMTPSAHVCVHTHVPAQRIADTSTLISTSTPQVPHGLHALIC